MRKKLTAFYGFLAISNESVDKVIGNIDAGQEVSITWDVKILTPFNDTTVTYGVTAESDNSASIRQVNIIYVEGISAQDNTLIFGQDQWSFSNSSKYYGKNENYYLTEDDYEALVSNGQKTMFFGQTSTECSTVSVRISAISPRVLTALSLQHISDASAKDLWLNKF